MRNSRGGKNRRAREHCSQEMLNSCRKFLWMKICYWKFEGNLNTHVPLWAQQHMVDRHYSLEFKTMVSQNTICLCTCRFSIKILRWSAGNVCLQVVLPGRKFFFPALRKRDEVFHMKALSHLTRMDIFPILAYNTVFNSRGGKYKEKTL